MSSGSRRTQGTALNEVDENASCLTRHQVQFSAFPFRRHLEQAVAAMLDVLSSLHAAVLRRIGAAAPEADLLVLLVVHLCVGCALYVVLPHSNSWPEKHQLHHSPQAIRFAQTE